MRRFLAVLLLSALAAESPAFDRRDLKRMPGVWLEGVEVAGADPRAGAGKKRGSGWRFRQTPGGTLIYRPGGWGVRYLNYDHRGKDPMVGLVPEPGPGCYWTWDEREEEKKKNSWNNGYRFPCIARPANGPMKGWSLAIDGGRLVVAKEPAAEVRFWAEYDDLRDGP